MPFRSSNRSHGEESEENEGRAKGHRLSHHPEEDEDNNDEMLSDADEVGPEEQLHNVQQLSRSPAKYDSDNVHMPNVSENDDKICFAFVYFAHLIFVLSSWRRQEIVRFNFTHT